MDADQHAYFMEKKSDNGTSIEPIRAGPPAGNFEAEIPCSGSWSHGIDDGFQP
jgi:hypothetical protein